MNFMNKLNLQNQIYHKTIDTCERILPWMIMVHGFTHNSDYFSKQIEQFQDKYRLLLLDLRGHGQSSNVQGPYGVEEYADDIYAIIKDSGIERATYWGTHTGSAIGLVLAIRKHDLFNSLILEGTSLPGFDMPRLAELVSEAQRVARSEGVEVALDKWFNSSDWFAYMREHPGTCRLEEHKSMLFKFTGKPWISDSIQREITPVAQHLTKIELPVLVYNGAFDLTDFKKAASFIEDNLSNIRREEIENAGGFPAWENPEAVNSLVCDFLQDCAKNAMHTNVDSATLHPRR